MKRKMLALIMAAAMVLAMLPGTVAAAFADTAGHWADAAIARWAEAGALSGYSDGSFKPDNPIKRGEFFKIIDAVIGYGAMAENRFADLRESDWYYEHVLRLAKAGVVTGDAIAKTVRGEDLITREEAFAVLARAFHVRPDESGIGAFADAGDVSPWACAEVGGLAAAGYVQGAGGYLRPKEPIKRAEVAAAVDRIVSLYIGKAGTYGGQGGIAVAAASGVVLENAEIQDLHVSRFASGTLTLRNTRIKGTLYIYGNVRVIGDAASSAEAVCAAAGSDAALDLAFNSLTAKGHVTAAPFDAARIETVQTAGALKGVGEKTFGGSTQLKVTGLAPGAFDVYVSADEPEPEKPNASAFDASALAVPELKDLLLSPKVKADVWMSYRAYATLAKGTRWESQALLSIPGLDKLPKDLIILGFASADGSVPAAPAALADYGGAPLAVSALPGALQEGTWFTLKDGENLFIVLYPEPPYKDPAELTAIGSSHLFVWPAEAGTYDPSLDGKGILPGTHVYSCYDIDLSTYTITRTWDPPASLAGYRRVNTPAEMEPNTWCVLTVGSGASAYSYVLVSGKALLPVESVTKVDVGAPSDLEFKARDAVAVETGKSINITALLDATGNLPEHGRAVTWTVVKRGAAVPAGAFTAKISVIVTEAKPFAVQPAISVSDGGVRGWDEAPVTGDVYLVFTSDVHYDKNATAGENLFKLWMESLSAKIGQIEYMTTLGDNTSAYGSGIESKWANIAALMELADTFKEKGFVKNDNLFLLGNHERWVTAGAAIETVRNNPEYPHLQPLVERLFEAGEPPVETPSYILYSLGAEFTPDDAPWYGAGYGGGGAQMFLEESIEALDKYLASKPKNIPVFVLSHFPIHTYVAPEGSDRETGNALKLINVLNKYPNVIFLWGHNHSSADPMYDEVYGPGSYIAVGPGVYGETVRINFFYASAGAMSDFEYRSDASSTSMPGGVFVEGKGMLVGISGSAVNVMWYERPWAKRPEFVLPPELVALQAAAIERKAWYGAGAYRLQEEITESPWRTAGMAGSGGWAVTGAVLGGGTDVVILGFKGPNVGNIASGITQISGYEKAAAPGQMAPGRWGLSVSPDGGTVFVILYAVSDGTVWLPKFIGGAEVMSVEDGVITLWDGVDDGNGSNWEGTLTWDALARAVTALDPVTTDGAGKAFAPGDGYTLKAGQKAYTVVSTAPPKVPAEVAAYAELEGVATLISFGFDAAKQAGTAGGFSTSAINALTDLASYGDKVAFIRVSKGLVNFAEAFPDGIAGYGKALSDASVVTAEAFDAIRESFVPGTWFYAASGSATYIILYMS